MKKNKILIVASTASMIEQFNKENIKLLNELGFKVIVATNFVKPGNISIDKSNELKKYLNSINVTCYNISFERNPFNFKNIKAYMEIYSILKDNLIYAVHCHSPIGGVIGRIAAKIKGVRYIIYTAHGFHFYKGSSIINWILYYPIEKILSYFTDILITINNEDYLLAKKKLKSKKIIKINGAGFDNKFIKKSGEFKKIGSTINIVSVGELNDNKNHIVAIKAIENLILEGYSIKYSIVGDGENKDKLIDYIHKNNLSSNISLLGFSDEVSNILDNNDIFCFPSKREGLSISLLEAMASGLPCVVSNIRGNNDLIDNYRGGILVNFDNSEEYAHSFKKIFLNPSLYYSMSIYNIHKSQKYSKKNVGEEMKKLYLSLIKGEIDYEI